jgi:hypothetical protein
MVLNTKRMSTVRGGAQLAGESPRAAHSTAGDDVAPYRAGLVVGVECMFAWYWLDPWESLRLSQGLQSAIRNLQSAISHTAATASFCCPSITSP